MDLLKDCGQKSPYSHEEACSFMYCSSFTSHSALTGHSTCEAYCTERDSQSQFSSLLTPARQQHSRLELCWDATGTIAMAKPVVFFVLPLQSHHI